MKGCTLYLELVVIIRFLGSYLVDIEVDLCEL